MRNIRFCLCAALRRVGVIDRGDTPISATWSGLLERLTDEERACLIAWARLCSARQIDPYAVPSVHPRR